MVPMKPQGPVPGLLFAHFGWRLLANLIDSTITGVPQFFIFLLAIGSAWPQIQTLFSNQATPGQMGFAVFVGVFKILFFPFIIGWVINFIYGVCILYWLSGTPGMRLLGMRVVNEADLQPISLATAVVRWAVYVGIEIGGAVVGFLVPFGALASWIDPLWCLWDDRKQTLHDKVAHTFVVKTP